MRMIIRGLLASIGVVVSGGTTLAAETAAATDDPAAISATTESPARTSDAPAARRAPRTPPYFPDAASLFVVLPPAPTFGDARDEADRRIFRQTRALQGSSRWQMAIADAQLSSAQMLRHFACSLDIELTPEQAPRLVALAQKATREAAASAGKAKDFYKRHRPFVADDGPLCVAKSTVEGSYDYPSGHTTAGWGWGLVLAQVDPSRAVPLLTRGRAIGDSRVVCGVHNASAVEGARMLTGAAFAAISASPAYQADLLEARKELDVLRATAPRPDPERCALEAELVKPYW